MFNNPEQLAEEMKRQKENLARMKEEAAARKAAERAKKAAAKGTSAEGGFQGVYRDIGPDWSIAIGVLAVGFFVACGLGWIYARHLGTTNAIPADFVGGPLYAVAAVVAVVLVVRRMGGVEMIGPVTLGIFAFASIMWLLANQDVPGEPRASHEGIGNVIATIVLVACLFFGGKSTIGSIRRSRQTTQSDARTTVVPLEGEVAEGANFPEYKRKPWYSLGRSSDTGSSPAGNHITPGSQRSKGFFGRIGDRFMGYDDHYYRSVDEMNKGSEYKK